MKEESNELARRVLGDALEVHRGLGPGLLESAYEECLAYEMSERGLRFRRQARLPVSYKGVRLDCGYRLDFVVSGRVVIEVKSVEVILKLHLMQLLGYLRNTGLWLGLLINFTVPVLKSGIRRVVN